MVTEYDIDSDQICIAYSLYKGRKSAISLKRSNTGLNIVGSEYLYKAAYGLSFDTKTDDLERP